MVVVFGFYFKAHIQKTVPKIIDWIPNAVFAEEVAARSAATGREALATIIRRILADGVRSEGSTHGVVLLTRQDDDQTVHLTAPIANDTKPETGKAWAWTLGQRYTSLERLQSGAARTSQL